jgi:hypothetical protein
MDIDPNVEFLNPAIVQLEPAARNLLTSSEIRETLTTRDAPSVIVVFWSFRSQHLDLSGKILSEHFSTLEITFENSTMIDQNYVDSQNGIDIVYQIPIDASLDERIIVDVEYGMLVLHDPAKGLLDDLSRSVIEALGDR